MKRSERVRTSHDEWTKRALSLWLRDLGGVQCDVRIPGEARRGDVLFKEHDAQPVRRKKLGVLGELARGYVLFEPFRNPATPWELVTCVMKAVEHSALRLREARRAKEKLSMVERTALCVITPSASAKVKREAGLRLVRLDEPGVYRMANLFRTVVVVVRELAKNSSTLWLRLLGRDAVQLQALEELRKMDAHQELRNATFELIVEWLESLPKSTPTDADEELERNMQRVYPTWREQFLAEGKAEGLAEGKAEGKAEGLAQAILTILARRGLSITVTQRKQILACKDIAQLDAWLAGAISAANVKEVLAMREAPPAPRPRQRAPRRAA